jgi:hypothetical protein
MDTERILEDQTVIIRGNSIVKIGPTKDVQVPAEAILIEGGGKYLMPGLADMHVHIWNEEELFLFIANGVTTVRNMWGSPLQLGWQKEVEAGERLAPTIYTTGPLMDGSQPIWPGSTVVDDPEDVDRLVAEQKKAGYQFIKVYNGLSKDVYQALVEAASEHGLRVVGHVPDDVGLEEVLASRQASIEHMSGYRAASLTDGSPVEKAWNKLPLAEYFGKMAAVARKVKAGEIKLSAIYDEDSIEGLAVATREAGIWNVPTRVVFKYYNSVEAPEVLKGPNMEYVDPATRSSWDPSQDFILKSIPDDAFTDLRIFEQVRRQCVSILYRNGARILLGTDTPNPFVIPGFSIHEELQNLVDAGMTPYEALSAGTAAAAEFLEAEMEFGTIAEGMRADLILLDRNPLEDVGNLASPDGVMARGKWLSSGEIQTTLDALSAKYDYQIQFREAVLGGNLDRAISFHQDYSSDHSGERLLSEDNLNLFGYELLGQEQTELAIEVFVLNTREYPESSNAWDSLGEAYMADEQRELAIESYRKSLELDPSNENARQKLSELEGDIN